MIKSILIQAVCALGTLLVGATVWADPLPVNPNSWTLAILPDTQKFSASNPSTYNAQTQFLVDYQDDLNLAYVLHEGDITDNNSATQWTNAYNAMKILDGASIGYSMAPGNHDYDQSNTNRTSNMLSATSFKVAELAAQPTYGGVYEAGSFMNSYSTFNAGGKDWLVLALEYGPRDGVVAWADGLMKSHPNHQAMIVTHANLYCDSTLYNNTSQQWNPHSASAFNTDCNVGEEVWQELKDNSNLKFIFNGHVLEDGTGYMADTGDNGNTVHNLLANYQMIENGGNGYMRLLEFMPDGDTVHVRTYSPTLGTYLTSPSQDFTLSLASPLPLAAHAVGANFVVTGEAKPASNSDVNLSVPQSASPQVGITWQKNRGDYELTIGNKDVTYNKGILLATVAQNVRDGYRATVAVGRDSFGDGQMALSLMEAGNSAAAEVNFNTSVAWFEFDAGWQGAHINANGTLAAAQGITQPMITKSDTGRYGVDLDVNSINNGMLFAIGNSGSTNVIVDTGVLADGSGWDIRVQNNVASFSPTGIDNDWSLLYLPYNTKNLIGGRYNGNAGSNLASAGTFTMTRLGTGQYKLTIPGETPETGMLILTVSYETSSGGNTAPDDNILNYQSDGLGNFIINSYDLTNSTALTYQNTEFVWAFIDFSDPIRAPVAAHAMTWNATHNGVWAEAAWTGTAPTYPNYSADAVVNTPWTVTVIGDKEAILLSISGGGKVTIAEGSSLELSDHVTVASDGTFEIHGSLIAAVINVEGILTADTLDLQNATLNVINGGTATVVNLTGTGTVLVGGTSNSRLTAASICVSTLIIGGPAPSAPVPEPSICLLLVTAVLASALGSKHYFSGNVEGK